MKRLAQHRRKETDSPTSLVRALLALLRTDKQAARSVPALAACLQVDIMRVRSICDALHGLDLLLFSADGSLQLNEDFSLGNFQPVGSCSASSTSSSSSSLMEASGYSSSGDERDEVSRAGGRARRGSFDSLASSGNLGNGLENTFCKSIVRSKQKAISFSKTPRKVSFAVKPESDPDSETERGLRDTHEDDDEVEEEKKLDAASVLRSLTGKSNGPSGKKDLDVFFEHVGTIQMRKRQRLLDQCTQFTKHKISMCTQSSGQVPYMKKHLYLLPRDLLELLAKPVEQGGIGKDSQVLLLRGPPAAEVRVQTSGGRDATSSFQIALTSPCQPLNSYLLQRNGLTDLFRANAES
jgi:hypothetical protein